MSWATGGGTPGATWKRNGNTTTLSYAPWARTESRSPRTSAKKRS